MSILPGGRPVVSEYRHYSEIERDIQTGDLLCWRLNRVKSFVSLFLYLYHKLFKATYSHVGIALRLGEHVFVVEAIPDRVRMIPLHMLKNFYWYKLDIPFKKSNVSELLKHLGKLYSVWDMVKSMMSLQTSGEDLYCSELAWMYYESIGFFPASVDEFDETLATPDDLVKMVTEQSNVSAVFVKIDNGNIHHAS